MVVYNVSVIKVFECKCQRTWFKYLPCRFFTTPRFLASPKEMVFSADCKAIQGLIYGCADGFFVLANLLTFFFITTFFLFPCYLWSQPYPWISAEIVNDSKQGQIEHIHEMSVKHNYSRHLTKKEMVGVLWSSYKWLIAPVTFSSISWEIMDSWI